MQDQGNKHPRDEDSNVRGGEPQHDDASTDPREPTDENGDDVVEPEPEQEQKSAEEPDSGQELDEEQPEGLELSGLSIGSASDEEGAPGPETLIFEEVVDEPELPVAPELPEAPELPAEAERWVVPELPEEPEQPELPLQSAPSYESAAPTPPAEGEPPLESMAFEEVLSSEPAPTRMSRASPPTTHECPVGATGSGGFCPAKLRI